jgi:hypothetical protein
MKQENNGFAAFQAKKELKDRQHWERLNKHGHLPYIAVNILMWLGSFVVVRALHVLCFRLGGLHSSGSNSLQDISLCAIIAGAISAEVYWSGMKRKSGALAPEQSWTLK